MVVLLVGGAQRHRSGPAFHPAVSAHGRLAMATKRQVAAQRDRPPFGFRARSGARDPPRPAYAPHALRVAATNAFSAPWRHRSAQRRARRAPPRSPRRRPPRPRPALPRWPALATLLHARDVA